MKNSLLFCLLLIWACGSETKNPASETQETTIETPQTTPSQKLQNGDLIFHTSTSNQSLAIQIATDSRYSHVGMIYEEGENLYVYEAVQPIKMTPLADFIKRGKDGKYVVKRLENSDDVLTPESIAQMKKAGKKYLGKNYDLQFMWSDDKIYCSELVWKIYKEVFDIEIGGLQQIKDFDLSDPVVQKKVKERYGNNVPMEEPIITPDRMFQADNLVTVIAK